MASRFLNVMLITEAACIAYMHGVSMQQVNWEAGIQAIISMPHARTLRSRLTCTCNGLHEQMMTASASGVS